MEVNCQLTTVTNAVYICAIFKCDFIYLFFFLKGYWPVRKLSFKSKMSVCSFKLSVLQRDTI